MHYASVHQRKERTDGRRLVGIDVGGRPLKKVRDPNWDWVLLKWMFTKSPKMEVFRKKLKSSQSQVGRIVLHGSNGLTRDGVASFVTDPFFGMGSRLL